MNNLSMKIGKINYLSFENKEINNMYWIYSHFKCQKIAENAFPSCFQTRPLGLTRGRIFPTEHFNVAGSC